MNAFVYKYVVINNCNVLYPYFLKQSQNILYNTNSASSSSMCYKLQLQFMCCKLLTTTEVKVATVKCKAA